MRMYFRVASPEHKVPKSAHVLFNTWFHLGCKLNAEVDKAMDEDWFQSAARQADRELVEVRSVFFIAYHRCNKRAFGDFLKCAV